MARDQISREDAEALMRIQMPEAEKQAKSDYVIDNSGAIEGNPEFCGSVLSNIKIRVKKNLKMLT